MTDDAQIKQDIETTLTAYGQQIGIYLDALDIPASVKTALIEMMPALDAAQIENLKTSLESAYYEQSVVEMDGSYMKEATEIDKETIAELDAIINE